MIELKNVTKLYGKVIGVNDFTLTLEAGAYGLLGPNGAGKSTLLNLITGQLQPTLGSVRVLGRSPRNHAELFRHLGYCPGGEGMSLVMTGSATCSDCRGCLPSNPELPPRLRWSWSGCHPR